MDLFIWTTYMDPRQPDPDPENTGSIAPLVSQKITNPVKFCSFPNTEEISNLSKSICEVRLSLIEVLGDGLDARLAAVALDGRLPHILQLGEPLLLRSFMHLSHKLK